MIVQLHARHPDYPDLSEGQPYCVIGIEADEYRILDDAGRPFLYSPDIFDVTDSRELRDGVTEFGDDGERYSYPPALNEVGFFEDYFDRKERQVSIFWHPSIDGWPKRREVISAAWPGGTQSGCEC